MRDGLRQRRGHPIVEKVTLDSARKTVKNFDLFVKVQEDVVQKSTTGATVTVVASILMFFLFTNALVEFLTVDTENAITVDASLSRRLHVTLNLTFPRLRCMEMTIDSVDAAGDSQIDMNSTMVMTDLDVHGADVPQRPGPGVCLPCLKAAGEHERCCNTCDELKQAYARRGLSFLHALGTAEQCRLHVGCRVAGAMEVNKVSGNIHVALGNFMVKGGGEATGSYWFNKTEVGSGFNTSHEIHQITFGDIVPGLASPLDGTMKIVRHGAYMFHYYMKLVPTVFADRHGNSYYTNQYSLADLARNAMVRSGEFTGLPGVFLIYEFSPFLMIKTERVKPWSYIFTSMCAIVGGAFSIARLVEAALDLFLRQGL